LPPWKPCWSYSENIAASVDPAGRSSAVTSRPEEINAGGALLALHDAYRAAATPPEHTAASEHYIAAACKATTINDIPSTVAVAASTPGPVTCVTITWADGAVTTVYPPTIPARPADMTPAAAAHRDACRRGGALALRPRNLDPDQCLVLLREKGETVRWQPVSPTLMPT
jgi:hypothetical protein